MLYGKGITSDEALVEDVIQELFLDLWEKRTSTNAILNFDTYLYVSFRNNLIRRIKKQGKIRDIILEQTNITADNSPPNIEEKEAKVNQLINQLPPRQREVLFLRYYKNKSYQEISQLLGINYQVARNFAYRALQTLKKNWRKHSALLFSLFVIIAYKNIS